MLGPMIQGQLSCGYESTGFEMPRTLKVDKIKILKVEDLRDPSFDKLVNGLRMLM